MRPDARVLYVLTDAVSARLLRGQLRSLVDAGFEVHLACAGADRLEDLGREEGVTLHQLPLVREPSPLADLRGLLATVRLMRRLRPALVNAASPKAGLLGTLAARLCRVPVRVYCAWGFRFETTTGGRRRLLRALDRLTMACATHVLFTSRSLERLAVGEGVLRPGRGTVLGAGSSNGVDLRRFASLPSRAEARRRLGLTDSDVVIGFVGRLTRDKGIADLVAAFGRLAADRPALRLLVVGELEPGDEAPASARRQLVEDARITRCGWVEDPAPVYPAMDLLAFPSYREGLPNVPLEAQAAGVPVVGYAATGTVDALPSGGRGVLVPVGDLDALTTTMASVLDDPALAAELAHQGRAWVAEHFTAEGVWDGLRTAYVAWIAAAPGRRRRPTGSRR